MICNELHFSPQVCLMQYPLRPQWRPYELTEETTVGKFTTSIRLPKLFMRGNVTILLDADESQAQGKKDRADCSIRHKGPPIQ